jgi:hypothetical protein
MVAVYPSVVNVVVTCSHRKSATAESALLARNLPQGSVKGRAEEWGNRLRQTASNLYRAIDLYQGDHWATVRTLIGDGERLIDRRVNVWIASAGCGLIFPGTPIPAYGATFSTRDPDSVVSRPEARREWWGALARLKWRDKKWPSTVAAIAALYPNSPLLVAASPDYLDAMADDLSAAREKLSDSQYLSILCRHGALSGFLEDSKVYVSADLSSKVGGALTSLNARIVKWLITAGPNILSLSSVSGAVESLRQQCEPRRLPVRRKTTDAEIIEYIRPRLLSNQLLSGSAALSAFRSDGKAAEQKRFHRLFRAAREEVCLG